MSAGSSLAKLNPDMQSAVYQRLSRYKGRWTAELAKQFCQVVSSDELSPVAKASDGKTSKLRKKKKQPEQQIGILADLLAPEEANRHGTGLLQAEIVRYQSAVKKMRDELGELFSGYAVPDATVQGSMRAFSALLEEVLDLVRGNTVLCLSSTLSARKATTI